MRDGRYDGVGVSVLSCGYGASSIGGMHDIHTGRLGHGWQLYRARMIAVYESAVPAQSFDACGPATMGSGRSGRCAILMNARNDRWGAGTSYARRIGWGPVR